MTAGSVEVYGRSWLNPAIVRGNLLGEKDPYHRDLIRQHSENLGFRLVTLNETKSTMPIVDHLALRGSGPVAVLADHQTAGVGRDETKQWHDTPGSSILFSGLFQVDEDATVEFADLIALTTCLALQRSGVDVLIKAPNDIVDAFTGKKVSGILVRNIYDEQVKYIGANVGIGVNVHYTEEQLADYPTDYGATSVDAVTGKFNSRQDLLVDILKGVSNAATEATALSRGSKAVDRVQNEKWKENSYLLGKEVEVTEGNRRPICGTVVETEIGRGIVILTPYGMEAERRRVNVFDTDTKVRVV